MGEPALRDVVDGAALVEYAGAPEPAANEAARALAARLSAQRPRGLLDAIPGARNLLLLYEPSLLTREALERAVLSIDALPAAARAERIVRVPVHYGGPAGPDLDELARRLGMSPQEFARRHAGPEYRVAFVGFAPGFPYLMGLPAELATPRLPSPRLRVPAGSVGIGGGYTGIYPADLPGGWRLIGRTPLRLFDARASPPALLQPGDRVLFQAIDEAEFAALAARAASAEAPTLAPREPILRVLKPGLSTTVQGGPRYGLGSQGVPAGGAMDLASLRRANLGVGNAPDAAGLEITLLGPELEFLRSARICLSGSPIDASGGSHDNSHERSFTVRAGDVLRLGAVRGGARAYLAIEGGLAAPLPGEPAAPLRRGDQLSRAGESPTATPTTNATPTPTRTSTPTFRVVLGPQADMFTERGLRVFLSSEYRISSRSDRRGIRLEGPPVELARAPDIPPEGTAPGSVQVPADGLPIVLGPDRPVTGGYAKIATVIGADLPRLAQGRPGAKLRFRLVTLDEALVARGAMREP